jgi:hypothetical protein
MSTLFRWLADDEVFREQYARAKEVQAELMADEIISIADGNDDVRGNVDVQRDRLRVDARKWVAAKLLPKKYGERVVQEITGKDGGPIQTIDASRLSTAALAELMAARERSSDE